MHAQAEWLRYLIPIGLVVPLLYMRFKRMMRPVPLKLSRMWIRPVIFFLSAATVLAAAPPPVATWAWFFLAAAIGAGLGWQWGRLIAIQVDPANGTLLTRGSQAALVMMVLLLVIRSGLRAGMRMEGAALHLNAALVTDIFIVFSAFLFGVRGVEMFLRARRVLAQSPGH